MFEGEDKPPNWIQTSKQRSPKHCKIDQSAPHHLHLFLTAGITIQQLLRKEGISQGFLGLWEGNPFLTFDNRPLNFGTSECRHRLLRVPRDSQQGVFFAQTRHQWGDGACYCLSNSLWNLHELVKIVEVNSEQRVAWRKRLVLTSFQLTP